MESVARLLTEALEEVWIVHVQTGYLAWRVYEIVRPGGGEEVRAEVRGEDIEYLY